MDLRVSAVLSLVGMFLFPAALPALGAEILLPQNREAYFTEEPIEIAVAGLAEGEEATVTLVPDAAGLSPLEFTVRGDGSTVNSRVPAFSLAPGGYRVLLAGSDAGRLSISRGLHSSTMYVSQTMRHTRLGASGGNFAVSNAFSFGLLRGGQPDTSVRRRSSGMNAQEVLVAADVPSLIYMYWTGYVLHKPWGAEKSWASRLMTENTRLLSFHTAQRLRRYRRNILSVGTLDEPGLPWGKTPAGGAASGFPNWDTAYWYEQRGWDFTVDPASRPRDDWLKYMRIRCSIIGEQNVQAQKDLTTVWPDMVFSTDLYAAHAIMDGTDPLNQRCNDIPCSHVFLDWGTGKLGAMGSLYLEKAHDPAAKVAHAMNGQLFGETVPQPASRHAYHLMLNSLMAAGLKSNWWLNYNPMKEADLKAVNMPAQRIGPVFAEMAPADHDVALLWSFTEIAMRCKDITAKEAHKKSGEQLKLMVADLPENSVSDTGEVELNAYSVGGNYKQEVLTAHQALNRAGYPAHIVHEGLLPDGMLKNYRTLVVVGQTHELPDPAREAIEEFVDEGGKVVVDASTTVELPAAITTRADVKDAQYRWGALWALKEEQFENPREWSLFRTNYFMDRQARKATASMRETMEETDARPVMTTDSPWLGCERHVGGEGELHMIINAHETLPDLAPEEKYYIYNYAPFETTFTLDRIEPGTVVYLIEGLDWTKVSRVQHPAAPQKVRFEPGEMKLYLVCPREPKGLGLKVESLPGRFRVRVSLRGPKMPWPLEVSVRDPAGTEIVHVYRATGRGGDYEEIIPIGATAPAGEYRVLVTSPVAGLKQEKAVALETNTPAPEAIAGAVRVFDEEVIRTFLRGRPEITVAYGSEEHRALAEKLAADLANAGVPATPRPEDEVWRKHTYPRIWDPYIKVFSPSGATSEHGEVTRKVAIESIGYFTVRALDEHGKEVKRWREEGTLAQITGTGFIDTHGPETFYEAGCTLYVGKDRRLQPVNCARHEVKTTDEVRGRWARPWLRLGSFVGAWNLVPQLPEAYCAEEHLILLGDSTTSELVCALQASELLLQVVDAKYPGPGKCLLSFAWSPFAVEKNVILVGATDEAGIAAGIERLVELASGH